jgi:hypothetical protein
MFQKLREKPVYIFIAYIVVSIILYYPTIGAGMVFDYNGWTMKYIEGTYKDALNSFGYPGLHQMEQFAFFTIYKLFKFNQFSWYIVFALLHGIASFIVFRFIFKWLYVVNFLNAFKISLLVSSLFLLSPLAADVVVNKVTIHYLMSNIYIFSALYFLILYYENSHFRNILLSISLFIFALFSLEISYVFPFIYSLIWLSLFFFNNKLYWSKKIILPLFYPFVILILFLLLHKLMIGRFIGHYGSEVHTTFNLKEIYSTVIRYFASYTVLFDYWPYKYKAFVSEKLLSFSGLLLPITFVIVGSIGVYGFLKKKKAIVIITLTFVLAVISLAPIANLYYAFMFPIENNRYSYLSSVFMYLFIILLVYQINLKKIRQFLLFFFFCINIFFLFKNIQVFSNSSKVAWGLINDFRWFDKEVIILVDPDIFNGAKMFSTIKTPTSFSKSLLLHTGIDRRNNIKSVYQMNFTSLNDSVNVTKVSQSHYKIEMAQWGTWFMKDMIGATTFENDWCRTEIDKSGLNFYHLYLKEVDKDVVLIYASGNKWSVVK